MAKKKKGKDYSWMRCPYCGGTVSYRSAKGIYSEKYEDALLLVCNNYPACDSYVKCHNGTHIPMGQLANKTLRDKRRKAHQSFNALFETGIMTKESAYEWLRKISLEGIGHIGAMGEYACENVIKESEKILKQEKKKGRGTYGREVDRISAAARC